MLNTTMSTLPHAPATLRNREPIWKTIEPYLADARHILEIASGTGEHIEYMAPLSPHITWQPSDANQEILWSIDERLRNLYNVNTAKHIDVCSSAWHSLSYDILFCANMIHISPWASTEALFAYAKPNQYLILYGPFMENGVHNAQSNIAFDISLKERNPQWGIRDLRDLRALGTQYGLLLSEIHPMPANNHILIWKPHR